MLELQTNYKRNGRTAISQTSCFQLHCIVYARHGRELMGFKSPVSVPCNVVKRNKITNRRQGRHREVGSEGSRSVNLRADEQKRHIRPSPRVRQHNMSTPKEQGIR